jgi:hypothetical protein
LLSKRQSLAAQDLVMSDVLLIFVLQFKTSKFTHDTAKVKKINE